MGLTEKEQKRLDALLAKQAQAEPEPVVASEPDKGKLAQLFLAEAGLKPVSANPYGRVGCAYGACEATFLPNGSGAWHHSNCPVGSQLWGLFQKSRKDSDEAYEKVLASAKELAERLAK